MFFETLLSLVILVDLPNKSHEFICNQHSYVSMWSLCSGLCSCSEFPRLNQCALRCVSVHMVHSLIFSIVFLIAMSPSDLSVTTRLLRSVKNLPRPNNIWRWICWLTAELYIIYLYCYMSLDLCRIVETVGPQIDDEYK